MQEIIISSRKNQIIKDAVSLLKSSANRQSEFIVEGARLCEDAAKSEAGIFRLFYTKKALEKYEKYLDVMKENATEIYIIEEHVASLLSDTKSNQGIFAVCKMPKLTGEIKGKILVMENIQDPSNMGTVLRTGEALGINTFVILGDCCDVFSPKVTRGSMGAVFRLNLIKVDTFENLEIMLNALDYKLYAAVVDPDALSITKVKFDDKSAVFIGNEGNGLSRECISNCINVTIKMKGRAQSLNASSAASVIMWEMLRDD